ncbi:hypothetical protein PAAG_12219 [Paracoccidioides lutzii Pb01]|uniref:Uncharacterized protein n=1 Tax=Paracoccidioides lutzii (strain ATCC MYA-826 / Pb01) TaxID=502779 RepID=A0A0A2V3Z8_PARBA|nr:hypothetical protein PAAG_12219 [Paracoccidioides lutzii Pb01]KGQ01092.1 hypothetical protein PAAG_12219 [Paracoccidioides lutzii Pb01]
MSSYLSFSVPMSQMENICVGTDMDDVSTMPEENQAGDTKGQRNEVTPPNQLNAQDYVLLISIQLGSAVHRKPNVSAFA